MLGIEVRGKREQVRGKREEVQGRTKITVILSRRSAAKDLKIRGFRILRSFGVFAPEDDVNLRSSFEPRTSNLEPRTSNFELRTSNLTSNLEPNLEPRVSQSLLHLAA